MSEHQYSPAPVSAAPAPQMQPPPKKGMGCWFWGCLGCFGVAVLMGLLFGFGMWAFIASIKEYTAEAPRELAPYELQEGQFEDVSARMDSFKAALDKEEAATLELTGDDLNAVMAGDPEYQAFKDNIRFSIEDDELIAEASIPLDEVPFFKGRYLNGKMSLNAQMVGETLFVSARSIETDKGPVPQDFMTQISSENLAKDLPKDPNIGPWIKKLSDVRIEDGTLILKSGE